MRVHYSKATYTIGHVCFLIVLIPGSNLLSVKQNSITILLQFELGVSFSELSQRTTLIEENRSNI